MSSAVELGELGFVIGTVDINFDGFLSIHGWCF